MTEKFNVYDVIAVLIPGATFLWCAQLPHRLLGIADIIPTTGTLTEGGIFLLMSYGCGLMLQGFSYYIVQIPHDRLKGGRQSERFFLMNVNDVDSPLKKRLIEIGTANLGLSFPELAENSNASASDKKKASQQLFRAFNDFLEARGLAERPQRFNAQYGLFRAFTLAFFLLAVEFVLWHQETFGAIPECRTKLTALYSSILWVVLTILSALRMDKRSVDYAGSVARAALVIPSEHEKRG